MNVAEAEPHISGAIAALRAGDLGFEIHDGEAPKTAGGKYCVVYGLPGGRNHGTLEEPFEDAEIPLQLTCVGATRRQADWVRDKATLLLCAGFAVEGRLITLVIPEGHPVRSVDREVSPSVFSTMQRLTVRSTPGSDE